MAESGWIQIINMERLERKVDNRVDTFLAGYLYPQERSGDIKIQATAGMLIFLYGYGLLVLEKYREGRREELNRQG